MSRATWKSSLVLLAVAVLAGCAEVPTEDIASADEAMDAARAAEAPDYAPQTWAAAEDHRAQLESELEVQQEAFALSRSYDHAKSLAVETKELADKAAAEAATGKETARENAAQSIEEATKLRQEVDWMLEHAPRGKGTTADLAVLQSDASSIEASLKEAQSAYDAGRFLDAHVKADSALSQLQDIKSQIERAKQVRGGA